MNACAFNDDANCEPDAQFLSCGSVGMPASSVSDDACIGLDPVDCANSDQCQTYIAKGGSSGMNSGIASAINDPICEPKL